MKKINKLFCFLCAVLLLTWSCSNDNDAEGTKKVDGSEAQSELKEISFSDSQKELVGHSNVFTFDMLRALNSNREDNNVSFVVSPLSSAFLLGMVYDGSEGVTRQEIQRALGFDNAEDVNQFFAKVLTEFSDLDPEVEVGIANALFVNDEPVHKLWSAYRERAQKYYGALVEQMAFSDESALATINEWISLHTNGKITGLLPSIDPTAAAYLANATTFLAPWQKPFDEKISSGGYFRKADNEEVVLPMMEQQDTFDFYACDDYEAVLLPYGQGGYKMMIVLPSPAAGENATEAVDRLISSMDAAWMKALLSNLSASETDVIIPHFATTSTFMLKETLQALGISTVFSSLESLITGICEDEHLCFQNIIQKANIVVSEKGTEATAGTVNFITTSDGEASQTNRFVADHPFVYLVMEEQTGTIMFIGKYMGD